MRILALPTVIVGLTGRFFRGIRELPRHPRAAVATLVAILIALTVAGSSLLFLRQFAGAATYLFVQNNWTGGPDDPDGAGPLPPVRPVHPTNQAGWTAYDSKTSLVDTDQPNLALLGLSSSQFVQTTDTDFNAGTKTNTAVTGSGTGASVQLADGDDLYTIVTQQTNGSVVGTMARGASGNPVISYVGDNGTTLNLTVCNDATCSSGTKRTLATWSGNNYAYTSAVTINGNGNPVVIYGRYLVGVFTDWWANVIVCNNATCSSWSSAIQIDTGGGIFENRVHATTNDSGNPVFAYAGGYSGGAGTRVVQCTTATCSSRSGPVQVGDVNPFIITGSDGNPVIVTNANVYKCTTANCSAKNSVALANGRAAIAVGSDGIPTIAYYASTNLAVTRCTTASCTALTMGAFVDSANDVGEAPGIVMSSAGLPVISYMDKTTGQMKIVYCATANCFGVDHITTVGAMSFDTTYGDRGTSIILGSDNKPMVAYRATANINVADSTASYEPSGTLLSSVLDTQGPAGGGWGTVTWNNNANPTLSVKVRTSDSGTMTGAPAFSTCTVITKGADISANSCVNDTHRYIQYEATFSTSNPTITPQLHDITIQFLPYTTVPQDLISSWYDTNDPGNIFQDTVWVETLPANTNITFQLRTAPDAAGAPGTPSVWCGPDNAAAGCSGSFTDPSGTTETVDAELRQGGNDQWIQYKVTMQSTNGISSPTLTSVTLTYVVNAPPEFNPNYPTTGVGGVTAAQQTDGSVTINYSIRDPDTTQGSPGNQGLVSPTYQYSLNNGSSWTAIPFANMSADADDPKAVDEVSYAAYTTTWYPKQHISGTYANQTKVRVVVNDNELANNTAQADSAAFVLDVKNPASVALTLNAADESLVLAATDDTALTMNISLVAATFPPESEQPFASPVSMTLTENQTVYVRVTDARSNNTTVQATPPTTPKNVIIRDTSNASTSAWQEFISWEIVAAPAAGFGSYEVYRSVDGGAYAIRTTITDRLTNFYVDQNLTTGSNYAYKILTKDTPGNKSDYSAIVQDIPDGQGGTDVTPPTISSVTTASVDTTSATITWNTNELADSTVGFSLVCLTDPLEQSSPSFVLAHTFTITGLQPGTTYFYYVKSRDAVGNLGSDQNGGICYAFVTNQGPTIFSVGVSDIGGSTARVSWQTNFPADSEVLYSTSSTLASPQTQAVSTLLTAHTVTLTGLAPATRYYFDVRSTDALGNQARDTNAGNHYFFDTTTDTTPPAITNVRAEAVQLTSAVIRWDTDESSTSQVEYGTTSNYGSTTTTQTELVFGHSVVLEGLASGIEHHFRARSADATGNAAISADFTFTTIEEKKAGGSPPDPKDLTPPKISELAVTVLSSSEARATWRTDEPANTILRYGTSTRYGLEGAGAFDQYSKEHTVELTALKADTEYHAQVVAFDQAGNSAMSDDVTFRTPPEGEEPVPEVAEETPQEEPEPQPEAVPAPEEPAEESTEAQETIEEISSVSGFSVDQLLEVLREQFPGRTFTPEEFQEVVERIGEPPLIAGDFPRVQVSATEATITWITDRPANSLVAYTRQDRWRQDQPYPLEVGSSTELVKIHIVRLTGLSPATTYVFEVRSRGPIGGLARKGPFRFTTLSPTLAITDVDFVAPASDTLRFRWATSFPAFTTLTVTNVNTGKAVTLRGDRLLVEHEFTLADVDPDSEYRANIVATDASGNSATFPEFLVSTSKDTRPPIITQVRTQTALVESSFGDRVQTIITWRTNEQATSQVYYQEGAGNIASKDPSAYAYATDRTSDYSTNHTVVIASFRPNSVYQYIVVSEDRAGNRTISDPFAILTPQRRESVLQLILRNFEQLFRFLPGI